PLRGERRRGLMAHIDDVDPLLPAAVVDREEVAPGQGEQLAHAMRREPSRDQPAAMECKCLLRTLGGHRCATLSPGGPLGRRAPKKSARDGIRTRRLSRAADFKSADFASLSTRASRS